jgi:hypothetical protein
MKKLISNAIYSPKYRINRFLPGGGYSGCKRGDIWSKRSKLMRLAFERMQLIPSITTKLFT